MLEHLQCPKCGASLNPEGRADLSCSSCGARLRIQTGATGNLMAVLDDIKDDTPLLAKQALIIHLQSQIQKMEKKRARLAQDVETLREEEPLSQKFFPWVWLIGIYFLFGCIVSVVRNLTAGICAYSMLTGIFFLAILIDFLTWKTANKLQRQVARLDGEIGEADQKIQDLKAEIDQIVNGR